VSELVGWRQARSAILFAGLGYFVDIFDLLLFAVVRVPSVRDLGVGDRMLEVGTLLQNTQLIGLLVGGLAWGMLGDRRGRRSVLYGSIVLYSLATLANATATTVTQYVVWRFIAGVGLAGELGAALTIVSEMVHPSERGTATTLVATLGVMGAVAAAMVGELLPWRMAYVVGGVLGLVLLLLRLRVGDSAMFARVRARVDGRGDFRRLFTNRARALRYLRAILIGVPIWFSAGILITFAPEFAKALAITEPVSAGRAVLAFYAATTFGDLCSGLLSQRLRSRRASVAIFMAFNAIGIAAYVMGVAHSAAGLYTICAWLGFATGYWAVLVTMAVEQFGTDLRATVGTSVPTFIRASAVPMTLAFIAWRPTMGLMNAAGVIGAIAVGLAGLSLLWQPETYNRDLDFIEA
jgi:MFS transporter, putative metabolite:H+ symporter